MMGRNLFGGCGNRRNEEFRYDRGRCNTCGPHRRGAFDRRDDRFCPGCRSVFPRFPRWF